VEKRCVDSFEYYLLHRRGFTIRLKRFEPRAPDFGESQNFGSEENFQHFYKRLHLYFVLVQRTFLYLAANKISLQEKNEREGLK